MQPVIVNNQQPNAAVPRRAQPVDSKARKFIGVYRIFCGILALTAGCVIRFRLLIQLPFLQQSSYYPGIYTGILIILAGILYTISAKFPQNYIMNMINMVLAILTSVGALADIIFGGWVVFLFAYFAASSKSYVSTPLPDAAVKYIALSIGMNVMLAVAMLSEFSTALPIAIFSCKSVLRGRNAAPVVVYQQPYMNQASFTQPYGLANTPTVINMYPTQSHANAFPATQGPQQNKVQDEHNG